jgi:hypothetical protein
VPSCRHDIEEAWCGFCTPAIGPGSPLDGWIDSVSQVIPAEDEDPMPMAELIELTGLARHQVTKAVAAIRERHPDLPLVSDRNGIRFTMDADAVRRFRNTAARTALTRIRRGYRGVLLPYLDQSGASEAEVRRIKRQFDRVLEDVEDLVVANGSGGAARAG